MDHKTTTGTFCNDKARIRLNWGIDKTEEKYHPQKGNPPSLAKTIKETTNILGTLTESTNTNNPDSSSKSLSTDCTIKYIVLPTPDLADPTFRRVKPIKIKVNNSILTHNEIKDSTEN